VVGVDVNPDKVASLNDGRSPIVEKGLDELIRDNTASGQLRATTSTTEAIAATDLSLICVGTPSRRNGSLDLTYLERVCEQIGDALKDKDAYHVVVVRSTVLPGTTHSVVIPALERSSGKKYGTGFGVTVNPEFLREGTAINDFRQPPMTLIGHNYTSDARPTETEALYSKVHAPLITTSIRTAEMIKYASNTWHALKVCFANEVGNLCKRLEIDSHEVMDIFCRDVKLNLSSYYMKPGFAFGGSCLPKDVRAMQYRAKEVDLDMPVIQSILGSNELQIRHAIDMVVETGRKRVGLLGFSFKAGTDDLRESPIVILAEALLGKGYSLSIYDRNVSIARLVGANKEYINKQIPHLSSLLSDSIDEILDKSEVIVVGNGSPEFTEALRRTRPDQVIIDLFRLKIDPVEVPAKYTGICW
jgi:GDP-mannose 6-dehydrogenase